MYLVASSEPPRQRHITSRPIIGMLAMKITDEILLKRKPDLRGRSYIGASYVKFIQSAGGRVVPIIDDTREKENLDYILNHVNGVMLPGGEINLIDSEYYRIAKRIYEKAVEFNENNVFYPLFGVCRGFQALPVIASGSIDILKLFDSKNVSLPMPVVEDYKTSKMFRYLPDDLKKVMDTKDITANFHKYGIYPSEFRTNLKLARSYRVLGTSEDEQGRVFVAALEGKEYPFYGLQWHPEKAAFEWHPEKDTRHTWDAVRLGQYFANFFVNETRKNDHTFGSYEEELKWGIDKHPHTFTGYVKESKTPFDQIYVF
eukprot:gene530-1183_t